MEYLVHIENGWPADGDPTEHERLNLAERDRARELGAAGVIHRLWRVPGRRANWGLWIARDATELHAAIASLPFYPWLSIEVHPLAAHPNDPHPRPGPDRSVPGQRPAGEPQPGELPGDRPAGDLA